MKNDKEAEFKYNKLRPVYLALASKVALSIEDILKAKNINYHAVTHRVKEVESFLIKIENPKYTDPFQQVTDLAGIRVIAYVEDDVDKICNLIQDYFLIDLSNSLNKSQELGEDKVGYKSVHYVCQLTEDRIRLPEFSGFKGHKFEIQVRTILQHSWAEIEHDKNYKFSGVLPIEIKRRFKLVAGALEILDREFNQLSKDIDQYVGKVKEKTANGDLNILINSTSLKEYMSTKFESIIKEGLLTPDFHDSSLEPIIIRELNDFGINTLADLDFIVPDDFLDKYHKSKVQDNNFIGLLRLLMILNDQDKYFIKAHNDSWSALAKSQEKLLEIYGLDILRINKYLNLRHS